jgi:hypothetical protein
LRFFDIKKPPVIIVKAGGLGRYKERRGFRS